MGQQNSHNGTTVPEAKEEAQQYIAEPYSDEGQAVIEAADAHVMEVWEDGEVTTTKSHNGDLYRARSLHQSFRPVVESAELLFEVEEGDHKRMVVTDKEGLYDLLARLHRQVNGEDSWTAQQIERRLDR